MGVNKINVNNTDSNYTHSIFDISEYTGKSYDTLADALADVPDGKQKGGMTVSFVSTSDNKYVQYRLLSTSFSTNVSDWQGIDQGISDEDSLSFCDNENNEILHIDQSGVNAVNLKSNNHPVVTNDDVDVPALSNIGTGSSANSDEIVFGNDDNTEEYAAINSMGIRAKNIPIKYVVDVNGSGDFTSFSWAIIEAVKKENTTVVVLSGTYDLIDEFKSIYGNDFFDNYDSTVAATNPGLFIRNGVRIIFSSGAKLECNYSGDNSNVMNLFSPFNAGAWNGFKNNDFIIENMTIECSNVRYVIHDEMSGNNYRYTHHYKMCNMYIDNTNSNPQGTSFQYEQCIGGGLGLNGEIIIEGCVFYSKKHDTIVGSCVSYHNNSAANSKSNILVRENYIKAKGTFRLSWYGSSTKITEAIVAGNSFGSSIINNAEDGVSTNNNTAIYSINNEIRNN